VFFVLFHFKVSLLFVFVLCVEEEKSKSKKILKNQNPYEDKKYFCEGMSFA